MKNSTLVLVGEIGPAFGVKGDLKVRSHTTDPATLTRLGPLSTERHGMVVLHYIRTEKENVICRIEGVDDRTKAEAMRGIKLYADKNTLPPPNEDEVFYDDLIGMACVLENGDVYGEVIAVHNYGASDILEIRRPENGGDEMLAFTEINFPHIDITSRRITIAPPEEV